MENLKTILSSFEPISLNEMETVALMDRTDTKFVFGLNRLPAILANIRALYRVLTINNIQASKYQTLYFDTPDFNMYQEHQRRKSARYKIRHRIYVDSQTHFFEVKFKNNKGRTIKNRVKRSGLESTIRGKAEDLLTTYSRYSPDMLLPKLWSNCSRITLVNRYSKERLTLDIDLQFKNDSIEKNLSNVVIAEVKQEKRTPSPFIQLMKEYKIREGSISKYCFGVAFLYDQVKKNNFKMNMLTINKINDNENRN